MPPCRTRAPGLLFRFGKVSARDERRNGDDCQAPIAITGGIDATAAVNLASLPGGSYADLYRWELNTATTRQTAAQNSTIEKQ